MDSFKIYAQSDVLALVNIRVGETKLGEQVQIYGAGKKKDTEKLSLATLKKHSAKFVLLGIPEDVGVRANQGIGGTKTAWLASLKALLNLQSNSFLQGDELLVLGYFNIVEPLQNNLNKLRNKVAEIDSLVYPIIEKIVAADKIPIVIGGGHNNAFPIIWGAALALKKAINVVNIDAHADLRNTQEGRHSGNAFSHALAKGFLNKYKVFGLHQNYTQHTLLNDLKTNKKLAAIYFEDLLLSTKTINQNWLIFTKNLTQPCGLEIDLDSIANVLASAISPSGFGLNQVRNILLSNQIKFSYLHICEGATNLENGLQDPNTGKIIAYLVSDFIKALRPRI